MRILLIFALWAISLLFIHAQTAFSRIISNYPLDPESAWAIAEIPDGYIVESWGDCLGQDIIICTVVSKLDKNGNVVWFKQYDFYPNPSNSIAVRNDKIYICGATNQGDGQMVLYCLDLDGNILWSQAYGAPDKYEAGAAMVFTLDNQILILGTRYPDEPGLPLRVAYLVKTDLNGNLIDEYTYDFQNRQSLGWSIIETTNKQIAFSYDACPESCLTDFSGGVANEDAFGSLNWNLALPLSFQPNKPSVIQTDSNTLVVNWHTKTKLTNHVLNPPALFYLNLSGQMQDSLAFENQSLKTVEDIESVWEKGLVGCGNNYIDYLTNPNPNQGGWVFRVDKNKETIWDRTYTDTSYQGTTARLRTIIPTSDHGYIAIGRIVNNMTGVSEAHNWILKIDSLGCLQPNCNEINYITKAEEATFLKGLDILVYPNPATNYLNIQFPSDYSLGNLSAFLVNNIGTTVKKMAISTTKTPIEVGEIPAGIYYLMITKGNEIILSRRVIINR